MLTIHLVTLIASVFLGIIYSLTRWKSILAISVIYYGIYVYLFITQLGLPSYEIVPAALFCLLLSHGPFIAINSLRILFTNPKIFIKIVKSKIFIIMVPAIIALVTATYVFTNWDDIRCTEPQYVDVYNEDSSYFEEIKIIDKALNIKSLSNETYDVIRLYYLPSFSNEVVVEVKLNSLNIISIVKYYTIGKSIWDDQQAELLDSNGKVIGGRVKGGDEYRSNVNVHSDTITNTINNNQIIDILKKADLFSMKSISVMDETNCFISAQMDGNSYVVISKRYNKPLHYFEFDESNYSDQRYIYTKLLIEKMAANKR